ncbi:MAG: carbamoyltransferase [Magnetococcales bacterium]|nr:carbamoyltransferase [Magnetococcales bacterium]
MIIVGLHNTGILSSAAVVVDGVLRAGMAEERLDRRKHSKYFPLQAIEASLKQVGATLDAVDHFAVGWNPAINIGSRLRAGFSEWPAFPGARFYANPNHLLPRLAPFAHQETEQAFFAADGGSKRIHYVNHHLAHAANAFFLSPFDEAALLSCDGYGERASLVWAVGRGERIEILREVHFPHSMGSFYSALTQFLGFRPDHDEWKMMGAAAYGDAERFLPVMREAAPFDDEGTPHLNFDYFQHYDFDAATLFTPRLAERLGPPRLPDAPLEPRHFAIAAAAQRWMEQFLAASVAALHRRTGLNRLCLTGGVMMNCVANGQIAQRGPFDEVYIPYAPDDSGNSLGAALWTHARVTGQRPRPETFPASPRLGRAYDDAALAVALNNWKIAHRPVADPAGEAARLLAQGKILGWFQGRMEFGQRALGGRSILADPRDPGMKARINGAVKYRESFRPFAPVLPVERLGDYFTLDCPLIVPYMEKTLAIRPERREEIPAVVHADGTGRVQTVDAAADPLLHALLLAFERLTGTPVLLNTSLNLNHEPMVESPADAIRAFYTSGMDALLLGGFLVEKQP